MVGYLRKKISVYLRLFTFCIWLQNLKAIRSLLFTYNTRKQHRPEVVLPSSEHFTQDITKQKILMSQTINSEKQNITIFFSSVQFHLYAISYSFRKCHWIQPDSFGSACSVNCYHHLAGIFKPVIQDFVHAFTLLFNKRRKMQI